MDDVPIFADKHTPFAAFVEVTTGRCKLNGPWTDPTKANLPRALRALGAFPRNEVDRIAKTLYETGKYKSPEIEIGLLAIGGEENTDLTARMPDLPQLYWDDIKAFIFDRFSRYQQVKRERPQWDRDGHLLWKIFQENNNDPDAFAAALVLVTDRPNLEEFYESRVYR